MDSFSKEFFDRLESLATRSNVTIAISLTLPVKVAETAKASEEPKASMPRKPKPRTADLVLAALWKNPDLIGDSISKLAKRFGCSRSTLLRDVDFVAKYEAMCGMVASETRRGNYDPRTESAEAVEEHEEWNE